MGSVRSWINLTKEWNRATKGVKVYHSTDAANLAGEFKGWSVPKRDKLFLNLVDVILGQQLLAFSTAIRMNDLREVAKEHPDMAMSDARAYDFCFHGVVRDILEFLNRNDDRTNLVFIHEQNQFKGVLDDTFAQLKLEYAKPGRIMKMAYGEKDEFVPLQAADILAYEANKRTRNPEGKPRRPWPALNPTGGHRTYRIMDKKAMLRWAEAFS